MIGTSALGGPAVAVAAALDADPMNGPGVDTARRLLGIEYEVALQQALHARGVPFLTEGELRARGEAKRHTMTNIYN